MSKDKTITKSVQKYYKVRIICPNCHEWVTIEVPMGTRLITFLKSNTCMLCGCTYVKTMKEYRELAILGGRYGN